MRRREVQRFSRTVAAVLVTAAMLFAWFMSRHRVDTALDAQASQGAQLFAAHCSTCHNVDDVLTPLRASANPEAELSDLEEFLATHGDSSRADDQLIREYFASLIER